MGVRLLIAGSRSLRPLMHEIDEAVAPYWGQIDTVVCGMARGSDIQAFHWARKHGIAVDEHPVTPAAWERLGKRAGHERNARMGTVSDAAVVFIDVRPGRARGSLDMAEIMGSLGKPVSRILTVPACDVCGGDDPKCEIGRVSTCCRVEYRDHRGEHCRCD